MQDLGDPLARMRDTAPLVQNITNFVAMNVVANAMLAAGASPAMVHGRPEAADFARIAQALTINIGTASPEWVPSMIDAATAATDAGKPWVLDPVAVGGTPFRRDLGLRLLALQPSIIRGNASEIMSLSGITSAGKGADTADAVTAAEPAARALAQASGAVVAVTGAVDFVTDGDAGFRVTGGHSMMPRVTALGCALTGIVGAFAVGQDPLRATVAALAYFGLAGEVAGQQATGPASFQIAFIDALYTLQPDDVSAKGRVQAA